MKKIIAVMAALICIAVISVGCFVQQKSVSDSEPTSIEVSENHTSQPDEQTATDVTTPSKTDNQQNTSVDTDSNETDNSKSADTVSDKKSDTNHSSSSNGSNTGSMNHNSSSSNSGSTSKPSAGTNVSKPSTDNSSNVSVDTKPTHTCAYNDHSQVMQQPTCNTPGIQRNYCACGKYQDSSIPATGLHEWVKHFATKDVAAKTHIEYETKQVCNGCGAQFDTADEALDHVMAVFGDACSNYSSKQVPHEVVDEPAHTEQYVDYEYCKYCDIHR